MNSELPATKKLNSSNEDRLSSLPDQIVHHILSFTNTNLAAKTSILAQRWRHLWLSSPTLNFSLFPDHQFDESGFIHLIDQAFILRNGSNIQKFKLEYNGDGELESLQTKMYTWVLASVRNGLRELDLQVFSDEFTLLSKLPHCLYSSQDLTALKLDLGCFIGSYEPSLRFPTSMNLPRLKTLHLATVQFLDDNSTNALFSKSPMLESLTLSNCSYKKDKIFHIYVPSLKKFRIEHSNKPELKFKIHAPNLEYININCCVDIDYCIERFALLSSGDIVLEVDELCYGIKPENRVDIFQWNRIECAKHMLKLLRTARNVRTLTLSCWLIEVVSRPPYRVEFVSIQFPNLRFLHLRAWLSIDNIHAIMHLLKTSLCLETLTLEVIKDIINFPTKDLLEIEQFKIYHLKSVEIRGVQGCTNELKFMELLLKTSIALEKIAIFTPREKSAEDDEQLIIFSKKLLSFPRASSNIAILFF